MRDCTIYICNEAGIMEAKDCILYNKLNETINIGDTVELTEDVAYPFFMKNDQFPIADYRIVNNTVEICPGIIDKNIMQTSKLKISFPIAYIPFNCFKVIKSCKAA